MINALCIDVEDWYHPELVRGRTGEAPASQVSEAVRPLLELLDRHQTKASFFIVGELADQHPGLVRLIHQKGHEIGCHGFSHSPLWELNEALFKKELEDFQGVMGRVLGEVKVKGFRAPTFSLDERTQWALKILIDFGYQYDASIFPVKLNRLYGVRGAPPRPYRISLENVRNEDPRSLLIEFPLPLLSLGRLRIPISGGFYLRVLPLPLLYWGLKRMNRIHPFLLYFHPWEGYPGTPRLKLPLYNRFISYYGIDSAMKKLRFILQHFKFSRIDDILGVGEQGT